MIETTPLPSEKNARHAEVASSYLSALTSTHRAPRTRSLDVETDEKTNSNDPSAKPTIKKSERSQSRHLAIVFAVTGIISGVIILYVTAYANIRSLGIREASMRTQLRYERTLHETLSANLADLQSPSRITSAAIAMGLTRTYDRIDYLKYPRSQNSDQTTTANVQQPPANNSARVSVNNAGSGQLSNINGVQNSEPESTHYN